MTRYKRLPSWCQWTYDLALHPLLKRIEGGFLELCVADAGKGFARTLGDSFSAKAGDATAPGTADVLAFAFDELGTCKDESESWVTARHGLSRVLSLVAKYGGALRIRSGDAEVIYIALDQRFSRRRSNLGYEPQAIRRLPHKIQGSQIQLILPLVPLFERSEIIGRSYLEQVLPQSFRTQSQQFRGHLVPLFEALETPAPCVGTEELRTFRARCEKLGRLLLHRRPRNEPFIFDFSGLAWTAAQFETFLYLFQNIMQNRPVLLVEIDDTLANEVIESERAGIPTKLDPIVLSNSTGAAEKAFDELAEQKFLETYSLIHATVVGVTRARRINIYGLPSAGYEAALLSTLEVPASIGEICMSFPLVEEGLIRGILTPSNPLFVSQGDRWSLIWTKEMIETEMERAIVAHFDSVAVRSMAWRGRIECGDKGIERFYIPWSNVWRTQFLQASRILNRGRQVDEIAQRLLFRLKGNLDARGKSVADVKVLVCVSAPAMLLATALHRWWPDDVRPAVADLGHYVFLRNSGGLPTITAEGGIVIVQDVLDDGKITNWVVQRLAEQRRDVLAVIAFVRFSEIDLEPRLWNPPTEALVEVLRPADSDPPQPGDDDSHDYCVEPRSLRPVKFRTLRREFDDRKRDPDLERRNEYLEYFDNGASGCLVMSGHFVYGIRHFAVTVDIRRALEGEIGESIAHWVADVCEGGNRERYGWERDEGYQLVGDVTAVLMPLQSQIHYIWPKVERILAQRGRRQPMWLLEPAVFTGSGPWYRLPLQFTHQLERTVQESIEKGQAAEQLRILILDDAFASGRTATGVFATVVREIEKSMQQIPPDIAISPVQWIRYFSLLNQSDHATHLLWRHISSLSRYSVEVVVEEYAPFMGVTVYSESDCPVCSDRNRLLQLLKASEDYGGQGARGWILRRIQELTPVAVDGAEFRGANRPQLSRRLDVLSTRTKGGAERRYKAWHIDTAVWRLYELMYLSYPPSEILLSLDEAWPQSTERHLRNEYERYRWAVYEWCIRNWRRVVWDSAGALFCKRAFYEILDGNNLVERLLEAVATRYDDDQIAGLVGRAIGRLAELEQGRRGERLDTDSDRIDRAIQLDTALQLFFFNVQQFDRERSSGLGNASSEYKALLDRLDAAACTLDEKGHSLLRNLHRRLLRSSRFADPRWGLEVLAESLFRGRDRLRQPAGSHKLLPRLLSNVLKGSPDDEDFRLLHGSLVLFLAALEDLLPYADLNFSLELTEVKEQCEGVLQWLRLGKNERLKVGLSSFRYLFRSLELEHGFCQKFGEVFHRVIVDILDTVAADAKQKGEGRLTFDYVLDSRFSGMRVLTHVQRLILTLTNRAIDPINSLEGKFNSRIIVEDGGIGQPGTVCFIIMTNFASVDETARILAESRNTRAEESLLAVFGVKFGEWRAPLQSGYTSENRIYVPIGFSLKS